MRRGNTKERGIQSARKARAVTINIYFLLVEYKE